METEVLKKLEGKKIIFCLPGSYYSGTFVVNIVGLTSFLHYNGVDTAIAQLEGSCIHRLRNSCGGGHPINGLYQKPFIAQGENYDYIMWIDSDIVFTKDNFLRLFQADKDVVTGWYMQNDGLPACGFTDKVYSKYDKKTPPFPLYDRHNVYRFKNDIEIESKEDLYKIDWVGMGWMLIKAGVMEKVKFPWFGPKTVRVGINEKGDHFYDSLSEDLSFQLELKEAGIDIWMDPKIRLGHEKTRVI